VSFLIAHARRLDECLISNTTLRDLEVRAAAGVGGRAGCGSGS
jgi:hypothetical protein